MAEQTLKLTIIGKDEATNVFKKVSKEIKDTGDNAKKSKSEIDKMFGGLARFATASALGLLAKQAINAGDQLEGMRNRASMVFGQDFPRMEKQAANLGNALHRSSSDVLDLATSFASLAQGAGVPQSQLQNLGLDLAELTENFALFFRVPKEEAFQAIQGGMLGMGRALARYGIQVNDATLEEYAHSKGIKGKVSALSEAQQMVLRYNMLMEKTTKVTEGAARQAGTYADQVAELKDQFHDLLEEVGTKGMPTVSSVLKGTSDFLRNFFIPAVSSAITAYRDLFTLLGQRQSWMDQGGSGVSGAFSKQQTFGAKFSESVKALNMSQEAQSNLVKSTNALADTYEVALNKTIQKYNEMFKSGKQIGELGTEFMKAGHGAGDLAEQIESAGSGISGSSGKAEDSVDDLREAIEDLQKAYSNAHTAIVEDIKQLEFSHGESMENLQDQLGGVEESLADLAEQHKRTMDELTTDRSDTIAGQFQKIVDLEGKAKDSRQKSGFTTEQVVTVIQNRMDKDRDTLSERDIQAFNLGDNRAAVDQVNAVLELTREQEAFNAAMEKTIGLTAEQKESLRVGIGTDFVSNARKVLENSELSGGLTKSETNPLLVQLDELQKRADEESGAFTKRKEDIEEEKTSIQEKIDIEQEAFTLQKQALENNKIAVENFHTAYVEKLNDANGVTQTVVDEMKTKLEELKTTISSIDSLMQANAAITGGDTIASRVAQRREERGGLQFSARAGGGRVTEDLTLVGEFGPEMVSLPRGSFVHTAAETQKAMGDTVIINMGGVVVREEADEDRLIQKIARLIQLRSLAA